MVRRKAERFEGPIQPGGVTEAEKMLHAASERLRRLLEIGIERHAFENISVVDHHSREGAALLERALFVALDLLSESHPVFRTAKPTGRKPKPDFDLLLVRVAYDAFRRDGLSADDAIQKIADYEHIPNIRTFESARNAVKKARKRWPLRDRN